MRTFERMLRTEEWVIILLLLVTNAFQSSATIVGHRSQRIRLRDLCVLQNFPCWLVKCRVSRVSIFFRKCKVFSYLHINEILDHILLGSRSCNQSPLFGWCNIRRGHRIYSFIIFQKLPTVHYFIMSCISYIKMMYIPFAFTPLRISTKALVYVAFRIHRWNGMHLRFCTLLIFLKKTFESDNSWCLLNRFTIIGYWLRLLLSSWVA